jgi:hypothetical protein
MTATTELRWEPGSLPATVLERILLDVLADLYRATPRYEHTTGFRERHYRERLEQISEAATGIPLCGLPARTNGREVTEAEVDTAVQRFHATYGQVYSASAVSAGPQQAHDEAVQEGIEAVLTGPPCAGFGSAIPVTREEFETGGAA